MSAANQPGAVDDLKSLYREAIRLHAAHPVGFKRAIAATHRHELYNAQCGDRVEVALEVQDDLIRAAAFDGEACAICKASASILCSVAPGCRVDGLVALHRDLQEALSGPVGAASAANPGSGGDAMHAGETPSRLKPLLPEDMRPLLGVQPYPSRVQCATLPWRAARLALSG